MAKILGVAASLRNARFKSGGSTLISQLQSCDSDEALRDFLADQAKVHLQQFVDSGRAEGRPFDEIYKRLKSLRGDQGLSNSEVALSSALWSAWREGCDIEHLSLSEYFPATGVSRQIDELKERLRKVDGILVSTPVYFGDRGSLAQDLIDLVRDDSKLREDLKDKVYAGIAVGAKRNGGQETTLIYQLFDMINLGLLGVGNDSDTTSQYGGTGHAGDVGTMAKDRYGLDTSAGTGRRIAHVAQTVEMGRTGQHRGPERVLFWIFQDRDNTALRFVEGLVARYTDRMAATVIDVSDQFIARCIACDICPTHVAPDKEYRCIIRGGIRDQFANLHELFLDQDAIVPVVYCPSNRSGLKTTYQQFVERTRYLRRGDYVFSNALTAPLVLEDIGVIDNMHIRMATSMIRHHTVLTEPMVAHRLKGEFVNEDEIGLTFERFLERTRLLTSGRLKSFVASSEAAATRYNPVGYVLSTEKDKEDELLQSRRAMTQYRWERLDEDAKSRLGVRRRKIPA